MSNSPEPVDVQLYEEVPASIDELEEDPDNIRLENNPETVDGLSRALEYFGRYDVAPRVWRTEDGKLRALAGSGRIRAAKKARQRNRDLRQIPVIRTVPPKDRKEKIYLQFSENALRDALGPVDYGRGFQMLVEEGLTYDQILAELTRRGILSKSRTKPWITQMIQLIELDPTVQQLVNRGQLGVWQALQLRDLPGDQQRAVADQALRENLSRADMRLAVASAGTPVEAILQETRDLVEVRAAEIASEPTPSRRRASFDPDRRHGQVSSGWALPAAAPRTAPPRSKVAALERLEWYQGVGSEERELALEAVSGGHSPATAADLVQRAVLEAPDASQPIRDLLVTLRQVHQHAEELERARASAPAEFARLRLRSALKLLGG
jgi:hypothetical protein